ncbi:hypothetical protein JCM21714_4121 [Gracilibacillus boraciitolerans JCM 21714]|uniref:Uncharacterized protein n=2 Tax=Gracilibacillus boraciitolerans TaxID=307521 RepID=W4VP39_9BACI|nr:hypothetical protein JCM21714_4121 [Gracilibacillus boraciitolerans JCM 21714]
MANENVEPSKEAFDALIQKIEGDQNLPKGIYGISLHDNLILKEKAIGDKDNSLSIDSIIKH